MVKQTQIDLDITKFICESTVNMYVYPWVLYTQSHISLDEYSNRQAIHECLDGLNMASFCLHKQTASREAS